MYVWSRWSKDPVMILNFQSGLYQVSPKKRNAWFSLLWNLKILHILISSDKTLSSEKNDTKIIWFGSVVLVLQPFFETQSFTNFVKCARAIYNGYSSLSLFFLHGSMGFQATMYGSQKNYYPWQKCHKKEEKIINDYVLKNDNDLGIRRLFYLMK